MAFEIAKGIALFCLWVILAGLALALLSVPFQLMSELKERRQRREAAEIERRNAAWRATHPLENLILCYKACSPI